jgi:transposase InsO family protein
MIITDLKKAKHGEKRRIVVKWAEMLGVAPQTIYRALPKNATRRKRSAVRQHDGIEDAARIIAMLKYSCPEHRGTIITRDAKENALLNGMIDQRFATVPVGSFDRVIRDLGINQQRRRVQRFQAERPNEMHHVDASSSDCFYVSEQLPDGDYLLRLHKGHRDYKNKPIPVDGLRPWYYGVVDDHSGVFSARMIAARGESAADNMDFLCWAWSKQEGKDLYGLPDKLKGDLGPMMRSPEFQEFLGRLNVDIDPSLPGEKEAHGKIEVSWSKIWRSFEKGFFMASDWKTFTIAMSELMERFGHWLERYNQNKHRFEKKISKKQMWERINRHGGAVLMPENGLHTIVRRWQREVRQDGTFSLDGTLYEVKGLHDASVWVYQGLFDGKMVVVDRKTGDKFEVDDFAPHKLGEFKEAAETGYQKTRKAAAELTGVQNKLYTAEHQAMIATDQPRNVIKMPVKTTVREIVNPLDLDKYPSVNAAIADLQRLTGIVWHKDDPERAGLAKYITENGLSRRFVADLAGELQIEELQQMAM